MISVAAIIGPTKFDKYKAIPDTSFSVFHRRGGIVQHVLIKKQQKEASFSFISLKVNFGLI